MRVVNGVLGAGTTLLVLALGMGVVNYTIRGVASRRLVQNDHDLNAEALLLMY